MNIVKPSTIAGVMELLPEDQLVFDKFKNTIEEKFKKYAFLPIETPVIEKDEVLFAKGGGETEKQIFRIDSESKNMSLRFDLTVPLARYVSEHFSNLNFPFKRYQIAKVYRGERNQKGRYKEFYQCDIDIIGNDKLSIYNDAQLPLVIYEIFKELDFDGVKFHINNRKVLNGFLNSLDITNTEEVLRIIDKIQKIGYDKTKSLLMELSLEEDICDEILQFISNKKSNKEIIEELKSKDLNDLYKEGLSELEKVYNYMIEFKIPDNNIKIDLSITRGLDYYTSTVYETFLEGYEEIGSVCSGGRYDNLASNFSKQKLPGVGMSIGLTRLFYQFQNIGIVDKFRENYLDVLLIPMKEEYNFYLIELLNKLRDKEIKSDIYLEDSKMKKKFNYADKINAKYVIIVGDDEFNLKKYSLRDMKTGSQETLELEELVEKLTK
ncbi:MAG: histidine--tRNA ligase [Tissierellia bacterium]|nr:histidine--tRNA ligase [Tissierellia bacterium]